jgi:predicted methyltransferase
LRRQKERTKRETERGGGARERKREGEAWNLLDLGAVAEALGGGPLGDLGVVEPAAEHDLVTAQVHEVVAEQAGHLAEEALQQLVPSINTIKTHEATGSYDTQDTHSTHRTHAHARTHAQHIVHEKA